MLDKYSGKTFGGVGIEDTHLTGWTSRAKADFKMIDTALSALEAVYDASWGISNTDTLWGAAFTYYGASIYEAIGVLPTVALSTRDAEAYALSSVVARNYFFRSMCVEFGAPVPPTLCWGDNQPLVQVASNTASPTSQRHFLRRINFIKGAEKDQSSHNLKVATVENVTDFLTKYISGTKAEQSVAYLTNKVNEVPAKET